MNKKFTFTQNGKLNLRSVCYTTEAQVVYGTDTVSIPEGYKVVDFRPPVKEESFIDKSGNIMKADGVWYHPGTPRLIIRKRPNTFLARSINHLSWFNLLDVYKVRKGAEIELPDGWELADGQWFRVPKDGEFYLAVGLAPTPFILSNDPTPHLHGLPRICLKRVGEQRENPC